MYQSIAKTPILFLMEIDCFINHCIYLHIYVNNQK